MEKKQKYGPKIERNLSPLAVWALAFGSAVGWGAFIMPGTTFLPLAGPIGTVIGFSIGAVIMLVIAVNFYYMNYHYPDAGGPFSFVRESLGYDHGFLCTWFVALVYISIAWANATALPLIFRNLFGDILQFGFLYRLAGYDVYLGEALLSVGAICFFGSLCQHGGRLPGIFQTVCSIILLGGVVIGLCAAVRHSGTAFFAMDPPYSPTTKPFVGIVNIIALMPWAFVGFESVCHAADEFSFPPRKSFGIMSLAIIAGTVCYIGLTLLATTVCPAQFDSWASYINGLDRLSGLEKLPVFYAASVILGKNALIIFVPTLIGAIFTGILGNSFALSRLIYALAKEHMMPDFIGKTDDGHLPINFFPFLMIISIPISFLGRSVIGWIVDISTVGAAIAYMYTSIVTYKTAREENRPLFAATGVLGIIYSALFFLYFLIPNLSSITTLATESYMILVLWSILGFLLFRYIFSKDSEARFGNSTIVWIALLFLIFFTTTLWTRYSAQQTTELVLKNHSVYHRNEYKEHGLTLDREYEKEADEFLMAQLDIINKRLRQNSLIQMGLVMFTLIILFSLYSLIMRRQKQASDSLLKAKNDFLANMSHEIRTPINTILGMDEIILRESSEENVQNYAKYIQSAGNHLTSLINDILDYSRIEAGKLELVHDEYNPAVLFADIATSIRLQAQAKGLSLDVIIDREIPNMLYGDSVRLRQIMLNLLTNAVKYTEKGGATLEVSSERSDEDHITLSVSVSDTGIGIRKEDLDKLFNTFERFDEGRNRTIEGTGLGMNIVKELLELMDSHLDVSSVYGEGSVFSFAIEQKVLDWTPIGEFDYSLDSITDDTSVYQTSFSAPSARILLVDDTEMNLIVVQGLLKNTGITIDTALDGQAALSKSADAVYDLLLVDHRMPVMDGLEMLQKLRAAEDNPNQNTPCIALTANAGHAAKEVYLKAGFDDYLAKPVNGKRLEQMLISHLPEEKIREGAMDVPKSPAPVPEEALRETQDSPGGVSKEAENPLFDRLIQAGINPKEGIEYSGSEDMYLFALKFFRDSIEDKRREIIDYYDSENLEDYTTKVHGLKSSARVIGLHSLSEHARLLELAGKDGDLDYIHENTADVMDEYRSYKDVLADLP